MSHANEARASTGSAHPCVQVMLAVFGLPPQPHSDDPFRAASLALTLASHLSGANNEPVIIYIYTPHDNFSDMCVCVCVYR